MSSSRYKIYLFECITLRYVSSRCFSPALSVFYVLFSVVLTDAIVMLHVLSLLYAPIVCKIPRCWISGVALEIGVYIRMYISDKLLQQDAEIRYE
jgi:hypothetical protein